MARWKKIVSVLLLLVIVAGIGTALLFQNEIQAVLYYLQYSTEEQEALKQANEEKMTTVLEQANLSKEQIEQVSEEETIISSDPVETSMVASEKSSYTQKKNTIKESTTQKETAANQAYDAELAAMVGEIYALRTSFVGQLDDLLSQAKAEYIALPSEERETKKLKLVSKYVALAGGLEKSCDNQMEDILSRIQSHLKETEGDLSLIDEIRQVYKEEKALKKSYYLSLLD